MYQNHHLMHHLYPTIPFYRYGRAWKAREAWHREHSADMIIGPFGLGPEPRSATAMTKATLIIGGAAGFC